jgi:hypothetical protein
MKTIIAAAIAFLALASVAVADEHHGHMVKVCSFDHHHHHICHMVHR